MASLPITEVLLFDDVYRKLILNTLQKYTLSKLEDGFFFGAIRSNFENWTEEIWKRVNSLIWSKIKMFYIPCGV